MSLIATIIRFLLFSWGLSRDGSIRGYIVDGFVGQLHPHFYFIDTLRVDTAAMGDKPVLISVLFTQLRELLSTVGGLARRLGPISINIVLLNVDQKVLL